MSDHIVCENFGYVFMYEKFFEFGIWEALMNCLEKFSGSRIRTMANLENKCMAYYGSKLKTFKLNHGLLLEKKL